MTTTATATHTVACRAYAIGCAVENYRAADLPLDAPVAVGDAYLAEGTCTCYCSGDVPWNLPDATLTRGLIALTRHDRETAQAATARISAAVVLVRVARLTGTPVPADTLDRLLTLATEAGAHTNEVILTSLAVREATIEGEFIEAGEHIADAAAHVRAAVAAADEAVRLAPAVQQPAPGPYAATHSYGDHITLARITLGSADLEGILLSDRTVQVLDRRDNDPLRPRGLRRYVPVDLRADDLHLTGTPQDHAPAARWLTEHTDTIRAAADALPRPALIHQDGTCPAGASEDGPCGRDPHAARCTCTRPDA